MPFDEPEDNERRDGTDLGGSYGPERRQVDPNASLPQLPASTGGDRRDGTDLGGSYGPGRSISGSGNESAAHNDLPADVQADYERLSAGGQTPAVLLGPASGEHSAEQLAKVQQAREGMGLSQLSPFEAYTFEHGTPGGGQGPNSHHNYDDEDFAFDAPSGHAGDMGEILHHGQEPDRIRDLSSGGTPSSVTTLYTAPPSATSGSPAALVNSGISKPPPALVDVFRQIQNGDDSGRTNTALITDAWCLLDSGDPALVLTTATRKAWMRVNFPCKLISATVLADPSGNVTLDIQKTDYATFPTFSSIVGATPPTISGGQKSTDTSLSDWTVLLSRGDILRIDLTTNSAASLILLDLAAIRTDATDKTNS